MLKWHKDDLLTWAERAKETAKKKAMDKLPDAVSALQTAQEDTDALLVDQEYRLTLLELGIDAETFLV